MPLHEPLLRKPLLRKSPVRTRALLSANRANALMSTGPRTARGKHASALNALRHGGRARLSICWVPQAGREADAFWRFEAQLHDAILPLAGKGEQHIFEQALSLWIAKRLYDRLAASVDEEGRMRLALGLEPMPAGYRSRTLRPGKSVSDWMVTVSIGVAWSRGLGRFQQYAREAANDLAAGREPSPFRRTPPLPKLHARLILTTVGHPYSDNASERQGVARLESGRKQRTKPECLTKEATFENKPQYHAPGLTLPVLARMAEGHDGFSELHPKAASTSFSAGSGNVSCSKVTSQPAGPSRRTKPEYLRKGETSKNEPQPATNGRKPRNWVRQAISGILNLLGCPVSDDRQPSATGPEEGWLWRRRI